MRQINLLPSERRNLLHRQTQILMVEKLLQVVIYGLVSLTIVGIVAFIILYFLIFSTQGSSDQVLQTSLEKQSALTSLIAERGKAIDQLKALDENRIVWSDITLAIIANMPAGVRLRDITGNSSVETLGPARLTLRGQAANRSILTNFSDQLNEVEHLTLLKAPTENLLKRTDPEFQFELIFGEEVSDLNDGDLQTGASPPTVANPPDQSSVTTRTNPKELEDSLPTPIDPDAERPLKRGWSFGNIVTGISSLILFLAFPMAIIERWRQKNKLNF